MKQKDFYHRGMTFLELMVAISVLIVGISGTVGLISMTISAAATTTSQLKAAYLAQEGIEVVRNIRDSNWVKGDGWLTNIDTNCTCCEVAYNLSTITPCPGGVPQNLTYTGGFYGYAPGGEETIFSRKIETSIGADGHLRVKSTVYWDEKGVERSVTVVQNLYNWK